MRCLILVLLATTVVAAPVPRALKHPVALVGTWKTIDGVDDTTVTFKKDGTWNQELPDGPSITVRPRGKWTLHNNCLEMDDRPVTFTLCGDLLLLIDVGGSDFPLRRVK